MQILLLLFFAFMYYLFCGYSYNIFTETFYVTQSYNSIDLSVENIILNLQIENKSFLRSLDIMPLRYLYQSILDSLFTNNNGIIVSLWLCYSSLIDLISLYVMYTQIAYNWFIGTNLLLVPSSLFFYFSSNYYDLIGHCPPTIHDIEIIYSRSEEQIQHYINDISV